MHLGRVPWYIISRVLSFAVLVTQYSISRGFAFAILIGKKKRTKGIKFRNSSILNFILLELFKILREGARENLAIQMEMIQIQIQIGTY